MKQRFKHFSKSTLSVILAVCMLLSCFTAGIIATDAAKAEAEKAGAQIDSESVGTQTDTVNKASTTTMLVAAMTDSNDTYYSNKYVHMWNNTWNSGEQEVIEDYPAMTSANYNGVAYLKPTESKISTKSGNYIKYALCTAASWTNAWKCEDKTDQTSFTKGTQYMMYRTSSSGSGTFGTFTPITISSISYPDSLKEGVQASVSVSVTGGFPWFYYTKLSNTSEGKKYKVTVTNSAGTKIVDNQDLKYSVGTYTFNWTPASTTDSLTFTVKDNDSIDSVSYTKNNFSIAAANYTVTAEKKYSNDGTTYNNTLSADPAVTISGTNPVTPGDTVTVSAPTISGYQFVQWYVTGGTVDVATQQSGATITPSANCTVTAQYKKYHTVTLNQSGNGTLSFHSGSSASVLAGNTVTVDSTPNTGYAVSSWQLNGSHTGKTEDVNTVTFKPTGDVEVVANYSAAYTINTSVVDGHGTIAPANGTQVLQNGDYTVTLTPDPGYAVDYLKLDGVNITSRLTDNGSNYTFATKATANASYVVKYKQLTAQSITASVDPINNVSPASITSIKVTHNVTSTTYSGDTLGNAVAMRGDAVVITYAADGTNNPNFAYYQYSGTSGVPEPSHSSANHTVSFTMPDSNVSARLTFDEVNDVIYLTDAANWGTVKMHVSPTNGTTDQWCAVADLPTLPKSDDYTDVPYVIGNNPPVTHTIQVKYDSDKELYLIKGLSKANGGTMPYIMFCKGSDETGTQSNRVQAVANTLYKTVKSESPVKTAAGSFNYDDYEPEHEPDWPPINSSFPGIPAADAKTTTASGVYLLGKQGSCNGNKASDTDTFSGATPLSVSIKSDTGTEGGFWINLDGILNTVKGKTYSIALSSKNSITYPSTNITNVYASDTAKTTSTSNAPGVSANNKQINIADTSPTVTLFFVNFKAESTVTHLGLHINSTGTTYTFFSTSSGGGSTSPTVKIWAKDATIRGDYSVYDGSFADTYFTDSSWDTATPKSYVSGTGTAYDHDRHSNYDYAAAVPKGSTIYFKTTINGSGNYNKYYLKGYCINGKCYNLHTGTSSGLNGEDESGGVYKESFTIPTDWKDDYIEITPIYWLKDTANCITLYVQGYSAEVQKAGWGNTIGLYPYYQYSNNTYTNHCNNAYGGYPGQPFVNYNGEYFAQIPVQYDHSGKTLYFKGITFSNMFWDTIHRSTGEVSKHFQTYDYDDLYKIYKEGVAGNLKNTAGTYPGTCPQYVICSFKYRTKKNNDEPSTITASKYETSSNGNGWEYLTDYYGNIVDIFGNKIMNGGTAYTVDTISGYSGNKVHVISQDYRRNCAGKYATEWAVYNNSNDKITTIVPSACVVNPKIESGDSADIKSSKIDSAFSKYDSQTKSFVSAYKKLRGIPTNRDVATDVTGQPVLITYEKSIWGGADQADRCDARWYWSYEGSESIKAKIKVQYSTDQGRTWIDDEYSNTSTGTTATLGAVAKFTADADGSNVTQTTGVPVNKANNFQFQAVNSISKTGYTDYSFYGWAVERDDVIQDFSTKGNLDSGYYNQTSPKSSSATFIARYIKQPTSGEFTIYHDQHPQSTGKGYVTINAYIEDSAAGTSGSRIGTYTPSTGTSANYESGASVYIDNNYIKSNSTKYLRVVFSSTPRSTDSMVDPNDAFYAEANTLLTTAHSKGFDYISSVSIDKNAKTFTVVYNIAKMFSSGTQTVYSDSYMTKFKASSSIEYQIDYAFKTRAYGYKDYTVTGTLTEEDIANYFSDQMSTNDGITTLTEPFVAGKKPEESNFMQNFNWKTEKVVFMPMVAGLLRAQLVADQEDVDIVNAVIYDEKASAAYKNRNIETHYKCPFYVGGHYEEVDGEQKWTGSYVRTADESKLLYWDIFKLDDAEKAEATYTSGDTTTRANLRVAQCYSLKFNYVGFEDYYVRAVYAAAGETVPDRQEQSEKLTGAYASKLLISRNQWNNNVNRLDKNTITYSDVVYKDGKTVQGFTINDSNDSNSAYDKANTAYDRLYIDYVAAFDVKGLTGSSIMTTYHPMIKVEKLVDGVVKSTTYQAIAELDNKGRIEMCTGINGLTKLNVTKGTTFRFTPVLTDGNASNPTETTNITVDGQSKAFTTQSFTVDLYAYLNGEE